MGTTTTTTTRGTIKAVRIHSLGGPEMLTVDDIPMPEPGAHQLLIRVHAAGINPIDWKVREGLRGDLALPAIMGHDFSGVIEALGPDVVEFRVGEPVFGSVADASGSYAELAIANVTEVVEKPAALSFLHAAATPIPALTAWQALFDAANVQSGQRVLIHAAAGGVGSFAVQFAKWKGAHVIGTASALNVPFVRGLGADEVIDYRSARFEEVASEIDMVLDTIGGDTQERSWKTLKKGGILVSLVQPPSQSTAASRGVRGMIWREDAKRTDQLSRIADLMANRRIRVHVETVLPLQDARQAQELSQGKHVRGKIVLVNDGRAGREL